ncbi:MAG: 50S ribosomal protein L10 [Acidimicrobiia bacterium]
MTEPTRAPRPEKVALVEEIRTRLQGSKASVITEYRGLRVDELAQLRATLRESGTDYKIYKNTLVRRAVAAEGIEGLDEHLLGPVAIAFVSGDAVPAAKALKEFAKTAPALIVKAGRLGDRILTTKDVNALAEVEPREVLLAKLAGAFQAPLVKAAGLFEAIPRNFAYGLKALADKKAAEAA